MYLKFTGYLHFDKRMNIDNAREYLKDLSKHQYLPFINYKIQKNKWDKEHNYISDYRTIFISSHKDSYVYQYFNNKINKEYEKCIMNNGIDKSVCAFRKKIGCNIDFAGEVLNYITKQSNCYVLVADIKNFFDNLDHQILKKNLKKVLNSDLLSDDMYKMLKSVMKASYFNIGDIYKILKESGIYIVIDKRKIKRFGDKIIWESINKFGSKYKWDTILTKESFRKNKSFFLKPSKEELKNKNKGIVQGSPVSGTLSNVYMIDFDIKMNEIVKKLNGKYLRYCDDFIVVIPGNNQDVFFDFVDKVKYIVNDNKLEIKKEKLQIFKYLDGNIIGLNNERNNKIQFLGFELKKDRIIDIRESTKQRNNNKILKRINVKKNIEKLINKKLDMKIIYDKIVINGEKGDYKKYTFGNYQYKSAKVIGGQTLKQSKKKTIEFINRHYEK